MSEIFYRYLAKLYEPAYISQGVNYTGLDINTFQKKSGSRMQLAISIHDLSGGATLTATLENAATLVNPVYATVFTKVYTTTGIDTNIILDLNRYCVLTINITGGSATYSAVVTLVDNASSEDFSTETKQDAEIALLTSIDNKIINGGDGAEVIVENFLITERFDTILASYPTAVEEVYVYKNAGITVATVTVDYTDASKNYLVSVVRT